MMIVDKCSKYDWHLHIILYADNILLLAPTITDLEKLLMTSEAKVIYHAQNF